MKPFLKTKDYSVSQEGFELLHDEELDMLVTRPQPEDLAKYYESDAYISHTDANKTLVDKIYQAVKRYSIGKKLSLIKTYSKTEKTILDVGAGTGDFLLAAQKNGWSVAGVEPNYDARMRAQEKSISLAPALESLSARKFEVITLWHVLEHLPDIENQILQLVWHLEEEGTLIIAVPNFKSYDANYYKKAWAAYDVPRHLWHFSRTSIEKLFGKHGVRLIKTKPMIFDAFYVSLLSEKYKSGKARVLDFPKAFFRGLWSNCAAWSSKEYSSIIYVLKKD
jgi:2-polyprenyl-3-methyl-5-hydroxy-6-metoxy-1,4-benzoquinol methylase